MPFIEMPLGDVGEQYPVEAGSYNLTVLKAVEDASKAKKEEEGENAEPNMLVVTLGFDDNPEAQPFRAWFTYPDGGDYDDMRMRELKRFLYWFNVPMEDNGFNTDDVEGAQAEGIAVGREVAPSGREVNTLQLEPIPTEGEEGGAEATEEEEPAEEQAEEETSEEEATEEQAEEEAPEEEETPPARRASKPAPKAAPKKPAPKTAAKKPAPKAAPKGRGRR